MRSINRAQRCVQITSEIYLLLDFYLMLLYNIANSKPNWIAVEVKHPH